MNPTDAAAQLALLETRNRELEKEQARLQRQLDVLREETVRLQAQLVLKEGLEAQLQEALEELAYLRRQLYGEKSERLTEEEEAQLAEVAADLEEQAQREPPASADVLIEEKADQPTDEPRPKKRRVRHPLPEHLERQTVVIEPERLESCPHCGDTPKCIGEEVTEQLDYVPAKVVVKRMVRRKYACGCGGAGVQVAPLPAQILPQSKLGLALAVYLLLSRFDDHVAYYTLERTFRERHGVDIPRQQMVQWIERVAFLLQPLVRLMFEQMKKGGYLQIDETPVRVIDPEFRGKCARGFLWFYAVPGADVYLDFQTTRGRDAPHAQLAGFTGTIQTDGYEVYDSLKKVVKHLVRIGCAAHSRRKFHRAVKDGDRRAIWFIGQFRQLYRIEREARTLSPEQRQQVRREQAAPIWALLKERAQALQPQLLPQSSLGKAVSYLINEYQALIGYLESAHYMIDNNLVENSIRIPAVGRRRWLFIGHPDAGWRTAVIYSLIVSCRRRGINPQEYLTDVLRRLPAMNINQIAELLPANWKPAAPSRS